MTTDQWVTFNIVILNYIYDVFNIFDSASNSLVIISQNLAHEDHFIIQATQEPIEKELKTIGSSNFIVTF